MYSEEFLLGAFLSARKHVTGEELEVVRKGESPDFVVKRGSGSYAGVEITQVFLNPPDPKAPGFGYDWDRDFDVFDEAWRLIAQKSEKMQHPGSGWSYRKQTILAACVVDVPLYELRYGLDDGALPLKDCYLSGFREIWLCGVDGDDLDAYGGDIQLYGLFPKKYRGFHERIYPFRKPYG